MDLANRIKEYLLSLRTNNRPNSSLAAKIRLIDRLVNISRNESELLEERENLTSGRIVTSARRRSSRLEQISESLSDLVVKRFDIYRTDLYGEIENAYHQVNFFSY